MKKLKYIIIFILSVGMLNSCDLFDKETALDLNAEGLNVVTFERVNSNLTGLADGTEYTFTMPIKVVGPTVMDLTSDLTVTISANENSTAVDGDMYRIETPTITLTESNNYLGTIEITLVTVGNTPPMDGTPEFDAYVAPVLYVDIIVTGDAMVSGSGKGGSMTLNFTPPNPYAGLYDVEMRYFHPTAGGSHPSFADFNPDDPYGGIRYYQKELVAVTGRKCETGFAVWGTTDICWITCNADNSVTFIVDDTWSYDVALGNPFDASQLSHYDPADGMIYLYYHYVGTGGARIFWEVFTPTFPIGK